MHTVHLLDQPENSFFASALGLIFDTYDYDKSVTPEQVAIIDSFFDSLNMNDLDPTDDSKLTTYVTDVPYGQLISMASTERRWVYKGSLTTTNCNEGIYWNVVAKVYPIKARHLDMFKRLIIAENKKVPVEQRKITEEGNYRKVQPIKG